MSSQDARQCAVCHETKNLKQCCSSAKLYCGTECQSADWNRHKVTCLIGASQKIEKRLSFIEIDTVRKFEFLLDRSSMTLMKHWRNPATLELVYFLLDTDIIDILLKIPTTNILRTELVKPLLIQTTRRGYIHTLMDTYGFGENFLELLTYEKTGRVLVDITKFGRLSKPSAVLGDANSRRLYVPKMHPKSPFVVKEEFGIFRDRYWAVPWVPYEKQYIPGKIIAPQNFGCFEPDSPSTLISNKVLVAGSKISAMRHLGVPLEEFQRKILGGPNNHIEHYSEGGFSGMHEIPGRSGILYLARHFGISVDKKLANAKNGLERFNITEKWWKKIVRFFYESDVIEYKNIAMTSAMHGVEDSLNDLLIESALKKDIELIILTNMPGTVRQITEIVDVRNPPTLFKNTIAPP